MTAAQKIFEELAYVATLVDHGRYRTLRTPR